MASPRAEQDAATLGSAEREYLSHVDDALEGLPRRQRALLIETTREHLEERPVAGSVGELYQALGRPSEYAATLRQLPPVSARESNSMRSRTGRRTLAVLLLLFVVGGIVAVVVRDRDSVDPPELSNSCAGVSDPAATVQEAAGISEFTVPYQHNVSFSFGLCLSSPAYGVSLTNVRLDLRPDSLIQHGRLVEVTDNRGDVVRRVTPGEGFELPLEEVNELLFHVEFDNCENHSEGFTHSWSEVEVDVVHRSRAFSVPVELGYVIAVRNTSRNGCPRAAGPLGFIDQAVGIEDDAQAMAARDLCRFFEGVDTNQSLAERALFSLPGPRARAVARAAFAADCPDEAEHLDEVLALVPR